MSESSKRRFPLKPVILALSISLLTSCAGPVVTPSQNTAPLPESQTVPSLSPEPESPAAPTKQSAEKPVSQTQKEAPESLSSSQTVQLVWTSEPGSRLENASVPYIFRLEDGRFRLYYGGAGGILSAVSEDGLAFTSESGVRISSAGAGEMIVSDPTVVRLKDGRVRMYYKGANGPGSPGQSIHSIFSAVSNDGLLFQKEGIRIDSQKTSDRGWASVPDAVVLPDGRVRLYYVSDGLDVQHGIVSAISEDGLNFTREGSVLTGFVDPSVIKQPDGSYLMVAVAFPFGPGGRLTDAAPGIYSFTSPDGITFKERKTVSAEEGNIDPTIIDIGEKNYRIYYWNATDNPPVIRSIAGKSASASTSNSSTLAVLSAPVVTPVLAPRSIAGASTWLFVIDDGNTELALSAESDGKILMGRLNVTDPKAAVSWQTVASPADTGGISIADHWHIFAHGYHWLVFSVAGDSASYLVKLDKDFKRLALVPVGHRDGPTNDMFVVAEPDGVAVGHFAPGYGHTVHRFDIQAKKTGEVRIGGGIYTHANGSSAIPVEGGYLLFASESLNPAVTGAVRLIQFDASWQPVNVRMVLDEDGTNAAMATAIRLDSGYTIVHLRARTGVAPRQKASSTQPGSLMPDDSGALVRLVLAPDGTILSQETLVSDGTNRAHTTLAGDMLVTTWDETGMVRLRVDRIQ